MGTCRMNRGFGFKLREVGRGDVMLPPTHWNPMPPVVDQLYQMLCNRRNKYTRAQSREIVHRLICREKKNNNNHRGGSEISTHMDGQIVITSPEMLLQLGHDKCSTLYLYNCHIQIQLSQYHNVLSIRHCTARERGRGRGGEGDYTLHWQTMMIIMVYYDCDQL